MSILVQNVHDLVRSMLGDVEGELWNDDALMPFTQEAYKKAARALRSSEMGIFRKQSSSVAITAGQTTITRSGSPQLPADLVRPIELRERASGSGFYTPMNTSDGFIPSEAPAATIDIWDWFNDTIYLHACSANRDVEIQYEADLATVTDVDDVILIPDALGPLSKMVASMAARSRDELQHSRDWWEQAMEDLGQIAASEKRVKKGQGARFGSK